MEDPRIISALFIFLKMAYYNVLINSYSFSISVPGHTKSYKGILQFEKFAALIKTSETGSTEASALTPSCIHI